MRSVAEFGLRCNPKFSGGDIEEVPPDPIPNSEVKLFGADGTATVTLWESRSLPEFLSKRPRGCAHARFGAFSFSIPPYRFVRASVAGLVPELPVTAVRVPSRGASAFLRQLSAAMHQ